MLAAAMDRALSHISAVLDDRFGLDALYLHGSRATGRARADSDVDLAVLLRRPPNRLELATVAVELSTPAGAVVDLVDLAAASPVLAMQVLRHGRLVATGNSDRIARFVMRTVTDYADLQRVRAPIEAALRARFADG